MRAALTSLAALSRRLRWRFERTLFLSNDISVRVIIVEIAVLLNLDESCIHGALDPDQVIAELDKIKCNRPTLLVNPVNPLPFG